MWPEWTPRAPSSCNAVLSDIFAPRSSEWGWGAGNREWGMGNGESAVVGVSVVADNAE